MDRPMERLKVRSSEELISEYFNRLELFHTKQLYRVEFDPESLRYNFVPVVSTWELITALPHYLIQSNLLSLIWKGTKMGSSTVQKTTLFGALLAAIQLANVDIPKLFQLDLTEIGKVVAAIVTAALGYYINKPKEDRGVGIDIPPVEAQKVEAPK